MEKKLDAALPQAQAREQVMLKEEVDDTPTGGPHPGRSAGRLRPPLPRMEDELGKRGHRAEGRGYLLLMRCAAQPGRVSTPTGPPGAFMPWPDQSATELAKALADFLFDDERAMVRIDMSEYGEKHTGSAERPARLRDTRRAVTDRGGAPASRRGADEIEKAHPDVRRRCRSSGRAGFTDGHGRTHDFRTILILTSNLGSGGAEQVLAAVRVTFAGPPTVGRRAHL